MSTPSHISIAILARYSCDRCMGLRVWNAATVVQPFASNRARVSAGVRNSSPNSSGKLPADSTVTRPARFTPPCSITIFTPGCSESVVRKTERHSRTLSMAYFSETSSIAIGVGSPGPRSAISSPSAIPPAVPASTDNVMGIGQNSPSAVRISSHTPRQSASPMKPASGVNPPMPSITMSPASRDDTVTPVSRPARSRAAARASPSGIRGRSDVPPCGRTRFAIEDPPGRDCADRSARRTREVAASFPSRIVPGCLDRTRRAAPVPRRPGHELACRLPTGLLPCVSTIGRCPTGAKQFSLKSA